MIQSPNMERVAQSKYEQKVRIFSLNLGQNEEIIISL